MDLEPESSAPQTEAIEEVLSAVSDSPMSKSRSPAAARGPPLQDLDGLDAGLRKLTIEKMDSVTET